MAKLGKFLTFCGKRTCLWQAAAATRIGSKALRFPLVTFILILLLLLLLFVAWNNGYAATYALLLLPFGSITVITVASIVVLVFGGGLGIFDSRKTDE